MFQTPLFWVMKPPNAANAMTGKKDKMEVSASNTLIPHLGASQALGNQYQNKAKAHDNVAELVRNTKCGHAQ